MIRVLNYRPIVFALACAVFLVAGCGGGLSGVKVEGRIVSGGQPYAATEGKTLNLSFAGKDPDGGETTYPAKINADGSFVVDGPKGKGIPPGTYKVRLNAGAKGSDPASLAQLKEANQQFTRINSRECEVGSEPNQKITIDLAKGTIGK